MDAYRCYGTGIYHRQFATIFWIPKKRMDTRLDALTYQSCHQRHHQNVSLHESCERESFKSPCLGARKSHTCYHYRWVLSPPWVAILFSFKINSWNRRWSWLVCSLGAILLYWSAYLYPFATLLSGITEKHVPFRDAFTLFHLANITRYLPGQIW